MTNTSRPDRPFSALVRCIGLLALTFVLVGVIGCLAAQREGTAGLLFGLLAVAGILLGGVWYWLDELLEFLFGRTDKFGNHRPSQP